MSPNSARTVMHFGVLAIVLFGVVFLQVMYDNGTQAHTVAPSASPKKYIAFRDDDVAPSSRLATLKAVNAVHSAQNVPVTLGIVPHPYLTSENELFSNPRFLAYVRSIEMSPLFELAQHGYTHKDVLPGNGTSEFNGQGYDTQLATLRAGQDDMREAFGLTPTTFIPPFNAGNEHTLRAAATLGFKGYSAGEGSVFVTRDQASGLAISSTSISLDESDLSAITSATGDLLDTAPDGSTIVVLYHVWHFANADGTVNTQAVQTLALYMDYLKNRGDVSFVRLDHAAERVQLEHATQTPSVSADAENFAA